MGAPLRISSVSNTSGVRPKTASPIPIADHRDRVLADGAIVVGTEQAADLRTLAQRSEEVAGDELQLFAVSGDSASPRIPTSTGSVLLCAATSARPASSCDARSTTAEEKSWSTSCGSIDLRDVELVRIRHGQRTQDDGVDDRKDRTAGADAQRQ